MKLNKGDLVKYDNEIYKVVAVVFNTLYLQKSNDANGKYNYTMKQVYEKYHDIELI